MTREPGRTCLGCRRVRSRRVLVRLVRRHDGVVVVDPSGTVAGRGAWVCPEAACLERALQRGRLARAFRNPCVADRNIPEEVRGLWRQR